MNPLGLVGIYGFTITYSITSQKIYVAGVFLLCIITLMVCALYFRLKHAKTKNQQKGSAQASDNASSYQEIMRSLRNQEFLVNFTNYLNSPGDFTNKMNAGLNILGKYTRAESIYIFEDFGDGRFTKNIYEWSKPGIDLKKQDRRHVSYKPTLQDWKIQLIKDGILYRNNMDDLPQILAQHFITRKVTSLIVLPLYVYSDFFGFMGIENCEALHWDDMQIGFLKTISSILSNAMERRFYEEEIKNSEIKFKNIFNHSSDAVFIYNLKGGMVEVNTRACEALDQSREHLLKKHIESVFPEERVPREKLYLAAEPQDIQVFESELMKSNGIVFPVEISSRPILFNNEKAVLCVARDISERKEVQRQILRAIIQTEEKERGRIARDLHDGLGPLLSSLRLYTKVMGTTMDKQKREELLSTTNEVLDESMLLIKEISNNLSPHVLNDFGLASAIQSFCKKITIAQAIDIKFDSNVFDQRFEPDAEMVLFRILKELVNNTIKHALATRIEIFLLRTDKTLSLIYSDDGVGFDIKKVLDNTSSGMGISNIINRITSVNGRLLFDSQAGKGIQVKIEVELKKLANEKN